MHGNPHLTGANDFGDRQKSKMIGSGRKQKRPPELRIPGRLGPPPPRRNPVRLGPAETSHPRLLTLRQTAVALPTHQLRDEPPIGTVNNVEFVQNPQDIDDLFQLQPPRLRGRAA